MPALCSFVVKPLAGFLAMSAESARLSAFEVKDVRTFMSSINVICLPFVFLCALCVLGVEWLTLRLRPATAGQFFELQPARKSATSSPRMKTG